MSGLIIDASDLNPSMEMSVDTTSSDTPLSLSFDPENSTAHLSVPRFRKLNASAVTGKSEYRRIRCPAHRFTPLRNSWEQIMTPLTEFLKLQVRFNTKTRSVEMKTSEHTTDQGSLQKGADFCAAFMMGFEIQDAGELCEEAM